jgi:predicted nucleotide-binding protein (sugar kinase/HSP70/actin superfamily)
VELELWREFRRFGAARREHRAAVRAAYRAQESFRAVVERAGLRALEVLDGSDQPGVVLVGRPYNLYDGGLNLHLPRKLRSLYGVNLIPVDFLPLKGISVSDLSPNMYWDYGRKILQAARYSSGRPNLHLLYFTNFKCGPDSYVKAFAEDAAEKPFLAVQFDGHGNDAGALTRCEAYLDSIGALRWWTRRTPSTDAPSSCRGCAPPAPESSPQPCAV